MKHSRTEYLRCLLASNCTLRKAFNFLPDYFDAALIGGIEFEDALLVEVRAIQLSSHG